MNGIDTFLGIINCYILPRFLKKKSVGNKTCICN